MATDIQRVLNGRYEILGLLGQGGMGAVYRAQDQSLHRLVAIKERTPDPHSNPQYTASAREQFRREAQALAQLTHPNLPRIYDYFSFDENEYIVMDLIEGTNLSQYAQTKGPLPETLVLSWARQILDALVYLHSRNLIHRDIKPNNLILTTDERIVLVDFGLVKLFDPNNQTTSTTLRGIGTPEYAPLEQYAREVGRTDARTDIYALGATLYHFLAGKPPADIHTRLLNPQALPSLRAINSTVTFNTETVLERAMSLYPQGRYQTALDMQQAFGFTSWREIPIPVELQTPAPEIVETLRRNVSNTPADEPPSNNRSMLSHVFPSAETTSTPSAASVGEPSVTSTATIAPVEHARTAASAEPSETTQTIDSPTQILAHKPRLALKIVRGVLTMQLTATIVIEFIRIPAGSFFMGSLPEDDPAAQPDELPQRRFELDEYWISKYPITVAQYTVFTNATGRQAPFDFPQKSKYPVVNVTWFDASIFCQWASDSSGKAVRLPSEAEWEKAARGIDGRIYPWGNEFDAERLNSAQGKRSGTTPVEQFPSGASPYDVMDMVGNVWEWNSDWYDPAYYNYAPNRAPQGPESGHYKSLRGGAWFSDPAHVRAADRTHFNPENHYDYVGFRCVLLVG
ncbi:MAG TPA: bifunctional serine/threonine-protein kinase/formylglycine-generating enzyme family protein [Anaerolineae bacterium]|nr:bifunctional serine/threonine-protein kinase/formylglycine-generating enzyme family protein [Anaerolineae bacterium]